MTKFVEEYILLPQTGARTRRKRPRKLATFSVRSCTTSEGKKREQELSNIAKNAMEILQANGITAQTLPYPLAIADLEGNTRTSSKSKFLDTLKKCDYETSFCFVPDLCVVFDMLYFVHMPPPPSVATFMEYLEHLWRQTVGKYQICPYLLGF